jgi:uncharacterized protein with von Willebrand factor type A (vWA) domain
LRKKGIPVSVPEWLQFMKIVQIKAQQEQLLTVGLFFEILRIYAQTTLVKDKRYYALFYEAFDEYFLWVRKLFDRELAAEEKQKQKQASLVDDTKKALHQTIQTSSPLADILPYDALENIEKSKQEMSPLVPEE